MNANKPDSPLPLEIRDPALNPAAVLERVQQAVSRRRAAGAFPSAEELQAAWPDTAPVPKAAALDDAALFRLLKNLTIDSNLQEVRFSSDVPVLGPVIVAVRRAWNWMSTRWYVLPLFKQQSRYNEQVIVSMYRLAQANQALQAQVDRLENRLAALEQKQGGE